MVAAPLAALATAFALSAAPVGGIRMDATAELKPKTHEDELPTTWSDEHRDAVAAMLGKWQSEEESNENYEVKKDHGTLRIDDVAGSRWAELQPSGETVFEASVEGKPTRFFFNHKTKKLSVERFGETTLGSAWASVDEFKPAEKEVLALRQVWTSELSPTEVALADNLLGSWEHGVTTASKIEQTLSKYTGFGGKQAFKSLAFNVTKKGAWEVKADGGDAVPLRNFGAVFVGSYNTTSLSDLLRFYITESGRLTIESKSGSDWVIDSKLVPLGGKPVHHKVSKQRGGASQRAVSITVMVATIASLFCAA